VIVVSEKNCDAKGRWRNVNVGFRVSKTEAEELNQRVALSGLPKQEYILQCCLQHEVKVVCGRKVAREMRQYLEAILEELQFMEPGVVPEEEVFLPLKHILTILNAEEE
jgi:hypothetical protein